MFVSGITLPLHGRNCRHLLPFCERSDTETVIDFWLFAQSSFLK